MSGSSKAGVNFVEAAEVYAVGNQKRALSDTSVAVNQHAGKKGKGPEPFRLPLAMSNPAPPPQEKGPEKARPVRKRNPARKLEIALEKSDVWGRLKEVDAGISLAQWLALDKGAYADVRDGLKYLHGRQASKIATSEPMQINAVQAQASSRNRRWAESDGETDEEEGSPLVDDDYTDWDSTWSEASTREEESFGEGQEEAYDSEDTEYHYPYDLQEMKRSIPLRGPVVINGQVVQAVFDSGASVSVISKSLAQRLRLVSNGDQLAVYRVFFWAYA